MRIAPPGAAIEQAYQIQFETVTPWIESGPLHLEAAGVTVDGSFRIDGLGDWEYSGKAFSSKKGDDDAVYSLAYLDSPIDGKRYGAYTAFLIPKGTPKGKKVEFWAHGNSAALKKAFSKLKSAPIRAGLFTNDYDALKAKMDAVGFRWLADG